MSNPTNKLYYGDTLQVLRDYIPDQTVDLIYLDPPFNSRQDYNVLFAEKDGSRSASQITAFKDSWEWNLEAERAYEEVVERGGRVADAMRAFRTLLGGSDMLAYLAMMAPRLIELRRVLKESGSIYLHCDPTASHYLKLLMDSIFGPQFFKNEIIWKRTSAHGNASRRFAGVHDTLLFFAKAADPFWNQSFTPYADDYIKEHFVHKDPDGRLFRRSDLRNPGIRPNLKYDFVAGDGRLYKPHPNGWAVSIEVMKQLDAENRLFFPAKEGGRLRRKIYLDESLGVPAADVWNDLPPIHASSAERLGYPTQKPEALLERILRASSNEGDLVLDPFCGCGTTVQVAQKLNRRWIGIDITHLAIGLINKRLVDTFGEEVRKTYQVLGTPTDMGGANQLAVENKTQFQYWALDLCGAAPSEGFVKKGADRGIDGRKFFHDERSGKSKQIVFSVKGGQNVGVAEIRDLGHVITREQAEIGVYISLVQPTKPMIKEAAEAGFYTSPAGGSYPRIQILSIADLLLHHKTVQYPQLLDATFRKAPRFRTEPSQNLSLGLTTNALLDED